MCSIIQLVLRNKTKKSTLHTAGRIGVQLEWIEHTGVAEIVKRFKNLV
jgi:hypothetical protein